MQTENIINFRPYRCKGFLENGKRCKTKCKDYKIFCCDKHTPLSFDYDNMFCSICNDEVYYHNIFILKCGHYFHKNCLKEWLTKYSYTFSCPYCRQKYNFPVDTKDRNKFLINVFKNDKIY
jgi:hypothetical protein